MARRPAANANLPDLPLTLQRAFNACQGSRFGSDFPETDEAVDPAEAIVGSRLRELRTKQGLSIRALAAQSGLAINTLSMIENGKTSPSVNTLQILARVLKEPISVFFEHETVARRIVYTRKDQRPSVMVETTCLEHMGKDIAGNAVQPFVVTLEPGSGSGPNAIVHTGHEFVYCLSGQADYIIEGEPYPLKAGDSIVFESHLPHCWQNSGEEPAQIILVLIPADIRDRPADRHFPLE